MPHGASAIFTMMDVNRCAWLESARFVSMWDGFRVGVTSLGGSRSGERCVIEVEDLYFGCRFT